MGHRDCNIAGLTLVQVRRRSAELAIRAAIGASRASVVGTMVPRVVIAAAGGLAAAALAWWLISDADGARDVPRIAK